MVFSSTMMSKSQEPNITKSKAPIEFYKVNVTKCNQAFSIIFDRLNYSFKVACLFETQYHTVQTNMAFDVDEIFSDVKIGESEDAKAEHIISPVTGFKFNIIMTSDELLKKQLPTEFHHIVGDMNYFKVSYNKNIE